LTFCKSEVKISRIGTRRVGTYSMEIVSKDYFIKN